MSSISGIYKGGCKNGLANGIGKSVGVDTYEGRFKKGLPNGNGIYKWANGNTFEGKWKNGKRSGEGRYSYVRDGKDTVVVGIWLEDAFVKEKKASAYKVNYEYNIVKYRIDKRKEGNVVKLVFLLNGLPNHSLQINNIVYSSGFETNSGSKNTISIENVSFPFKCKISYSTQNNTGLREYSADFDFEIFETGEWVVDVDN